MKYQIRITEQARELVANMDLNTLLDQLTCRDVGATQSGDVGPYGSIFFHPNKKEMLAEQMRTYKANCTLPSLITTDMENGPGKMIIGATDFPRLLGCGVADQEDLAYKMGKCAALEGGDSGYNWTLSPCVDILSRPESPMVSTRSAGRTPEQAIKIAGAYMRGLQDHGMMATLKHFPGDGYDIYDQHLTTVINPQSKSEWMQTDGRIYRELIEQGAMSIMPGHIALPAWDNDDYGVGLPPPASLSKKLLTGLLREELGFDGIIVSDAINMGGVVNYMPYYDAMARFWECGGDILLFPRIDERFYKEMEQQVKGGKLSLDTLRNRAERVLSHKEQMGLFHPPALAPKIDYEAHAAVSRQIVDGCVRTVRDRQNLLPFPIGKQTKVLHVIITNNAQKELELYQSFTKVIETHSDFVTEKVSPFTGMQMFKTIEEGNFDLVICSIGNRECWGTNVLRLHGYASQSMMCGWMKIGTPVVFVSHYNPYTHLEYQAAMDTVINTYGSIPYTFERVLQGITGKATLPADPLAL